MTIIFAYLIPNALKAASNVLEYTSRLKREIKPVGTLEYCIISAKGKKILGSNISSYLQYSCRK